MLGAGWHPTSTMPTKEGDRAARKVGDSGEFDMLVAREGPTAMVDRNLPGAKGKKKAQGSQAEGTGEEGEEEVEKTFFQK